jgi:inosine-uridine nucleoside N-ribohydrolase
MRIHIDTDLGSDPDDACALAMVLGWPGAQVTGITTTIDPGGRRAGFVTRCLELAGRRDIPVAAGAEVSLTTLRLPGSIPDDERYWNGPVTPRPSVPGAALDLLEASIGAGATVVAIGPYTNLALLEALRPGTLARVPVVLMGGWVLPPAEGLPAWGPDMDWNVQCDTRSARIVVSTAARLTLVTLPVTLEAHLRRAHLPRLRSSGPLGELLARQAEAHAEDWKVAGEPGAHPRLPHDLLNFNYDPVACAVALGWPGAVVEEMRLAPVTEGDVLSFRPGGDGRPARVVVGIDGDAFTETWLTAVEAAQRERRASPTSGG